MYFSQFGEDKFLIDNYLLHPRVPRFYIELGALDGVRYSNTKALEDLHGWTGVLIEPIPAAFENLKRNRPGNVLVNSLVGEGGRDVEFRYFSNPDLQCVSAIRETQKWSNDQMWMSVEQADNEWLASQIKDDLRRVILPTQSLGAILRSSGFSRFGFLSLDVEGHELEVLKSHDWDIPISYILVEGNYDDDIELRDYLLSRGGRFEGQVHINMLFSFLE